MSAVAYSTNGEEFSQLDIDEVFDVLDAHGR